jgi:hypothetical protein
MSAADHECSECDGTTDVWNGSTYVPCPVCCAPDEDIGSSQKAP